MKYLVATFYINADSDLLQTCRDLLADDIAAAGFESFEDTDTGLKSYVQNELFDNVVLDSCIANFPIDNIHITYDIVDAEDKDWNQEWEEEGFEPTYVDDKLVIYDARHPETLCSDNQNLIEIGIEAKLAFGTGTHDTTQMIASTLLNTPLESKRVLDCGCGTGILGLIASKLGAKDVVGYDIDEWSVENTKHNAVLNGVSNIEVFNGNSSVLNHISGLFDVVLANINRNILLADMRAFRSVMNSSALLILSGFYTADVPILLEEAEKCGLHQCTVREQNDWCCLVLTNS